MYFCTNCGKPYKTGLSKAELVFVKKHPDSDEAKELVKLYDGVCPYCGAYPPGTYWEWLYLKTHKK